MRLANVAAVLLVALGSSIAVATATPAQADPTDGPDTSQLSPSQLDQAFLKAIKDKGLTLGSDEAALKLAHSTCDVLTKTGSVDDTLQSIKKATKWTSVDKIGQFGGYSVQAYCPKSMPKQ